MMKDNRTDDDDIEAMTPVSNLLNRNPQNTPQPPEIPFCGCLSVQYYQPFFDVNTSDVTSRLMNSVVYCGKPDSFLIQIGEKPDAYGPFWISTLLVFFVAVTSHIYGFLSSWMHGAIWVYDFESMVDAATIIFGYSGGAPVGLYFALRHLEVQGFSLIKSICLYGYSLTVFLIATLLCLLPSASFSWISLFVASISSAYFLLQNLAPLMATLPETSKQQSLYVMGAVGIVQLSFGLTLKFVFYSR